MGRLKYTAEVFVEIILADSTYHRYSWTTPVPFGRLLGKGGRWAREELAKRKIPGRSQIHQITVTVRRLP
jgi:hypothetical protein